MSAPDLQLARAEILTGSPRPAPEPTENELWQILDHINGNLEPKAWTTTEATTTEARQ
jgi:hypothetical protein